MSKFFGDASMTMGQIASQNKQSFERTKEVRLGTPKNPAQLVVQTEERMKELEALCLEKGWNVIFEVNEEAEENISDLDILKSRPESVVVEKTPGRNDPCSCGSGKKFKKCCG